MGYKSRYNWGVGICLKEDCYFRHKKCYVCINYSYYVKKCKIHPNYNAELTPRIDCRVCREIYKKSHENQNS